MGTGTPRALPRGTKVACPISPTYPTPPTDAQLQRLDSVALALTRARDVQSACDFLAAEFAAALNSSVAVLRRTGDKWHIAAEGMPPGGSASFAVPEDIDAEIPPALNHPVPGLPSTAVGTERWTGVPLDESGTWLLLLPGSPSGWRSTLWFEPLMRQVSFALQLRASNDSLRARERLLRRSHIFARRLTQVSQQELHQMIVDTIARAVGAEMGCLAVRLPEEGVLGIKATCGYPAVLVEHVRVPSGFGVLGAVFASGKPLLVHDVATLQLPPRPRYRTRSFMAVPLVAGNTTLGVVTVTDEAAGRPFDQSDFVTARVLAAPAALALAHESSRVYARELAKGTSIDPATGLANRTEFQRRVDEELERARRHSLHLALLMVDLDGFKAVNDTLGHIAGDVVLEGVARALERSVRKFDVCARYGGDEFAILTPGSDAARAVQHAERIRRRLELFWPDVMTTSERLPLTASVGVAIAEPGMSRVDLITRADQALYRAKADGRNCVRLAEETH